MKRMAGSSAIAALALCLGGVPGDLAAQNYPSRAVRVVVPYAPGGGSDILARLLSVRVAADLGQQFVVDNRPGGGATIGTQLVARSPADGYVVGLIDTAFTINPGLFKKLPYDTLQDFAPVTLIATSPLVMVVHPSVPAKSVRELVALAKARPGQLSFSSAGNGTAIHLAVELFKSAARVDAIHVPYKGGAPSAAALAGGEVAMTLSPPATIMPFFKAGKARVLAITGAKRFAGFPEVPTLAEAGVKGADAEPYWGLVAPAGTPGEVVTRIHSAYLKHIKSAELRERLIEMAFDPVGNSPDEFAAFIRADIEKWGKVIKASGIQPQ